VNPGYVEPRKEQMMSMGKTSYVYEPEEVSPWRRSQQEDETHGRGRERAASCSHLGPEPESACEVLQRCWKAAGHRITARVTARVYLGGSIFSVPSVGRSPRSPARVELTVLVLDPVYYFAQKLWRFAWQGKLAGCTQGTKLGLPRRVCRSSL
jgi:hypothetical protein